MTMKITAPLSAVNEIEMLLHHGADEIYCGVHPPIWNNIFGHLCWMNRRAPTGANLTSIEEVKTVTDAAHSAGVAVHVTLNAPFYSRESLDYVSDLAFELVERADIDTVIVNDINLLIRLNRTHFPGNIHLSSLGGCLNVPAVEFYKSLGVSRIILPRQLQYREIRRILKDAGAHMDFEVFAVNDGCLYEEAHCQTSHGVGGPFCLAEFEIEPVCADPDALNARGFDNHRKEFELYQWYQNNCGSTCQEDGLPNGPCSLCGFGRFRDWGVATVKIIGREAAFYRKMRSLQMVKAVMDEVRRGAPAENIADLSQRIRNTPEYCQKGYMCYFRGE